MQLCYQHYVSAPHYWSKILRPRWSFSQAVRPGIEPGTSRLVIKRHATDGGGRWEEWVGVVGVGTGDRGRGEVTGKGK